MIWQETQNFLVAHKNGKYFYLEESPGTTTPRWVDNPLNAKWICPWHKEDYLNPQPATFYFENSERMRGWLEGAEMVKITVVQTAERENL